MQHIFESLINNFIEEKVGIAENFLSLSLAASLKTNLEKLYAGNQLRLAGTGNTNIGHDKLFRSDVIHWLDRKHDNEFENGFFNVMDEFIIYLNESCYAGIREYEFHYTLYPIGSFYKRHLDQFKNNDSRKYSMILYLNADWKIEDGGQLCIYHDDHKQNIAPTNGKIVFFKSGELEHEVLLTNKPRMSITGWLKT
ncbi:MAG: 2OG-Fe(II) oxygenase [Bacteroidota bacterium]|nr:2OG-Fe(II) oxygenase [Bacteroidota bacterium]